MADHNWRMGLARAVVLAVAAALCAVSVSAATRQAAQGSSAQDKENKKDVEKKDPAKDQGQAAQTTAEYVGMSTCTTCHDDHNLEKNPHWKTTLNKLGGPAKQGCEGCHGPGSVHVSSGGQTPIPGDFSKMTAKQVTARCLECHADTNTSHMEQMNFEHSTHAANNVSCLDCHSIHHSGGEEPVGEALTTQGNRSPTHGETADYLLVKDQPQLCYGCHGTQRAQFNMPWHHKVNEGLIQCTDCHNPHGSFIGQQLRTAVAQDRVCFTCHEDKQGPFVFEHMPVKTDGCTDCHADPPHGSPNAHMLKYANINQLCLQCHTVSTVSSAPGIPSFHNQATQFQACTLCHTQIHGSNFDPYFFK